MSSNNVIEGSITVDGKTFKVRTEVSTSGPPPPPPPPPPGNSCIKQQKGANPDPNTWKAVQMTDDPTKWKVVDSNNVNEAHMCASQADAQAYIENAKKNPPPPPPPPPPPGTGFPYSDLVKQGGFQTSEYTTQQKDCVSDGKRWNIPSKKNVVNMHSWVFMTLTKEVTSDCTDKPWFSPKLGSHADSNSFLQEASVYWKGGFKSCRIESPHGSYGSIDSSMVKAMKDFPKFPIGKQVGIYVAQWVTPDNKQYISQWWYDFTNEGKGPYTLYAQITGSVTNIGGKKPLEGGPGNWQLVGSESECEYEYRGNGMSATIQQARKEEINPPDAPRGNIPAQALLKGSSSSNKEEDEINDCGELI